jgi:hypothetical protein
LQALLASLPAAARGGLAASVAADVIGQYQALATALAQQDGDAARRALHALAGLAHTLGDTPLAARCCFGEALLQAADPALCRWLGPAMQDETDAVLRRVAAALAVSA